MADRSDGVLLPHSLVSEADEGEEEEEEDHLGRILRGCFEPDVFERDDGRHHHHACETFRARDDMDDLLSVLGPPPGLDICEIVQRTVTHACRSIAALDGAETGGLDASPATPTALPKPPPRCLPFQLLQLLLESEATSDSVCRQLQCRPSLAVESWTSGNIGASLVILRRCEEALRSLLESSVKFLLSEHDEADDGSLARALHSSDTCRCLVSCCQRAPDLSTRIKVSLVHWVRESRSASLWSCYELLCDEIRGGGEMEAAEAADALVLQYQSRFHDFVKSRQLFLRGIGSGETGSALSRACAALRALFSAQRGEDEVDAQLISLLMESKTFVESLMLHAFSSRPHVKDSGWPVPQEAAANWRGACELVVPSLLAWIDADSDSRAFLSSWRRGFAAEVGSLEGGGGAHTQLMRKFSKALLSLELYAWTSR